MHLSPPFLYLAGQPWTNRCALMRFNLRQPALWNVFVCAERFDLDFPKFSISTMRTPHRVNCNRYVTRQTGTNDRHVMVSKLYHALLLSALLSLGRGLSEAKVNSSLLAISTETCFSTFECPSNRFCFAREPYDPQYRCLRRARLGEKCNFSGGYSTDPLDNEQSCYPGQICAYSGGPVVCVPQLSDGDLCGNLKGQCPKGYDCLKQKDGKMRCAYPKTGGLGSSCKGSCSDLLDLICENKVCVPQKKTGESCKDDYECLDHFCTSNRKCAPLQKEGQSCLEDRQCKSHGVLFRDGDNVYCNKHYAYPIFEESPTRSVLGRCIRDSKLIKTLGTKCSPKYDRCDHRRGLSCEWIKTESRFGCQQVTPGEYCTPHNKYSKCRPDGLPRACSLAANPEVENRFENPTRFFRCNPLKEKVPIGYPCNRGPIEPDCPKDATCEPIPGVNQYGPTMYGPAFLKACVYSRSLGQSCGSKFESLCKSGLKCVKGVCVKGKVPFESNFTHADFGLPCTSLPCVPGAKCIDEKCQKPTKIVEEANQPCYDTLKFNRVSRHSF